MLALPSSRSKVESNNNVLDALPYIDDVEYTESHRQLALKLIQEECKNYPMTKNYLKNLPEPIYAKFLTPRLKEQFSKMDKKEAIEGMDFDRYSLPPSSSVSKAASKKAWQTAIQNCKSQLGNQYLRRLNLDIMEEYGPESYLRFNKLLQSIVDKEEVSLSKLRSELYELNSRRKRTQLDAGEKLSSLGQGWVELVTKNASIEVESWNLEEHVMNLAKRLKVDPELPKD